MPLLTLFIKNIVVKGIFRQFFHAYLLYSQNYYPMIPEPPEERRHDNWNNNNIKEK